MRFYTARRIDSYIEDDMANELLNTAIKAYKEHLRKKGATLEELMEEHLRVMLRFEVMTNLSAELKTTFKIMDAIVEGS